MDLITKLKENFDTLESAIENEFMPQIARELKPVLEDKIIEQLDRGERGDGKVLPVYSPVSVGVFGKPPGPIKLKHEGDFRQGISVDIQQDGIEFFGKDPKSDMLMQDFGEEIIDLQPRSIGEVNQDYIIEELIVFVKDHTTK